MRRLRIAADHRALGSEHDGFAVWPFDPHATNMDFFEQHEPAFGNDDFAHDRYDGEVALFHDSGIGRDLPIDRTALDLDPLVMNNVLDFMRTHGRLGGNPDNVSADLPVRHGRVLLVQRDNRFG